ncbi:MAG: GNAT family N-acetyltransferase [Planctomycetes bacterium]|nr:GNAT family N-acetyltransferase [Planctomycetota bacterium]
MALADDAYRVRRAAAEDQRAMHMLLRRTWTDTYASFLGRSLVIGVLEGAVSLAGDWQEELGPCVGEWIAERGSRLIGLAALCARADGDGELVQLYVLPSHQRLGVGTALWDECIAESRRQGWSGTRLWVFERGPAVRFYRRRGAVFVRRTTLRLGSHEEAILGMRFAL